MRHVASLSELRELLSRERITGLVRLYPSDTDKSAPVMAEARAVRDVFPELPVLLVRGTIDEEGDEERTAEWLARHGIKERFLSLPVWWAVRGGRVIAVLRQSRMFMRELLGVFGGRKTLDAITAWIEETLHAERGTGRIRSPEGAAGRPGGPQQPSGRRSDPDAPTSDGERRPRDPWFVLGVPRDASPDQVRTAYRRLCAKYHPDKVAHLGPDEQKKAHDRIVEINLAYDTFRKRANS